MTAGVVLVLVGAVVTVVLVLRPGPTAEPASGGTPTTWPQAADTRGSPTHTSRAARPVDPGTALRGELADDAAAAEALVGLWIPQVSAKAPGMVVAGVTYDEARIWADFQRYDSFYPDALLIRSTDFSSFRVPGYWVTVVGRPFPTSDAVNTWCTREGYGPHDCFAKRLSHTEGPAGNTAPRN